MIVLLAICEPYLDHGAASMLHQAACPVLLLFIACSAAQMLR